MPSFSFLRALLVTDPIIIVITITMGSLSVLASLFDSKGRAQDAISRLWSRMILRVSGVKIQLQGLEKLDLDASYVFVSNHLSLMDTPVVLGNIPVRFLFLANKKYFRIPFLGTHLTRAGHLPVVPGDIRASLKSMSRAAHVIQERKISVLLFPEGRRSTDRLEEFKEGAAYIAIKSGVPAVPIAITGTREVLPMGSVHVQGGVVDLVIGEPIPTAGLTLKDRGQLTQTMREQVGELLNATAARQRPQTRSTRAQGFSFSIRR